VCGILFAAQQSAILAQSRSRRKALWRNTSWIMETARTDKARPWPEFPSLSPCIFATAANRQRFIGMNHQRAGSNRCHREFFTSNVADRAGNARQLNLDRAPYRSTPPRPGTTPTTRTRTRITHDPHAILGIPRNMHASARKSEPEILEDYGSSSSSQPRAFPASALGPVARCFSR